MLKALKQLVASFDDEHGLSETTFQATAELIRLVLGNEATTYFRDALLIQDNRRYLPEGINTDELWHRMNVLRCDTLIPQNASVGLALTGSREYDVFARTSDQSSVILNSEPIKTLDKASRIGTEYLQSRGSVTFIVKTEVTTQITRRSEM